jgi:hypothetical protein
VLETIMLPWLRTFDNLYAIVLLTWLAFLPKLILIRIGFSVALIEILVGVAAGAVLQLSASALNPLLGVLREHAPHLSGQRSRALPDRDASKPSSGRCGCETSQDLDKLEPACEGRS